MKPVIVIGLFTFGIMLFVNGIAPAQDGPSLKVLQGRMHGTVQPTDTDYLGAEGTGSSDLLGEFTWEAIMSLGNPLGMTSARACYLADGNLTQYTNDGSQLESVFEGVACGAPMSDGLGLPITFDGTYYIIGGTELFQNASGSGSFNFSINGTNDDLELQVNFYGTIKSTR